MTTVTLTPEQEEALKRALCATAPPVKPDPVEPIDPEPEPDPNPIPEPPGDWNGEKVLFEEVYGEKQDTNIRRAWASKRDIRIRTVDGFAFQFYYKPGRKIKFTLVGHPITRGGMLRIVTAKEPGNYETPIQTSAGDYGKINTTYGAYSKGWYWCSVSLTPESWPAASAQGVVAVEMQYSEVNL